MATPRPAAWQLGAALVAAALTACGGGTTAPPAPHGATATGPSVGTTTPGTTPSPTPSPGAVPSPTPGPTITTLGTYHIASAKVVVAGISSGGFFGVQMHVAHSSMFHGAAIYAGGVDWCAQDSVALALAECGGETVNGQALYESTLTQSEAYVDQQSTAATIDPESGLAGQPVYLWSGTQDQVVNPKEMADLASEYTHYGARVTFDNAYPANHGWESPSGQVPCGTAEEPYMITCTGANGQPYDSEQTWLTLFFGTLQPRNNGTLRGQLLRFDQTAFGAGASNSMDTNGTIFVPQSCAGGATCALVVALHGCLQGHAQIGDDFVTQGGIDPWADSNGIIVLYPYAIESQVQPYNPQGCWDWWGYDDPNYALKAGTQMSIITAMVQRITGVP
ncbi:MAG: PHB depolymerase family esterase [Vulcanimicrobiaceae bacterium]|jgi:poly(3-hydroxybutyrate) depolymerase